ncbi:MAG: hypothetical protein LBC92_03530, partial [Rickettsiales bacterium]|nr:hypothetical protein [Rickettsiales bacterium]
AKYGQLLEATKDENGRKYHLVEYEENLKKQTKEIKSTELRFGIRLGVYKPKPPKLQLSQIKQRQSGARKPITRGINGSLGSRGRV